MGKKILVTGGLGYIGSHTVVELVQAGYEPVILDNLDNSELEVLDRLEQILGQETIFFKGDVNDPIIYDCIFEQHALEAVIHFAAHKAVGESVEQPLKYYRNNVGGLVTLLEAMKNRGLNRLVFSSSCTVYGEPDEVPVMEDAPMKPASSPYGASKQMSESILRDCKFMETQCLRYFNPVGAHPSGLIGELPKGVPGNLVPFLTQAAVGLRPALTVFGSDYPTRDGTCIRDYIHIVDLAKAHVRAMERLMEGHGAEQFETFNIGTGEGHTVLELIGAFERVTGQKVPIKMGDRRPGDVTAVWADTAKAFKLLGFRTEFGLEEMMRDAWNWQQKMNAFSTFH